MDMCMCNCVQINIFIEIITEERRTNGEITLRYENIRPRNEETRMTCLAVYRKNKTNKGRDKEGYGEGGRGRKKKKKKKRFRI